MNNILTLYDMEFKRIYKIYFTCNNICYIITKNGRGAIEKSNISEFDKL